MNLLEKLYQEAEDNEIEVYNYNFKNLKKSMCFKDENIKAIAINIEAADTQSKKVVALAEELAHFETDSFYYITNDYNSTLHRDNRLKQETKAIHQAIKKIIPYEKIQQTLKKGHLKNYEIAEECGVTTDFLNKAFEFYKTKGIVFEYTDC